MLARLVAVGLGEALNGFGGVDNGITAFIETAAVGLKIGKDRGTYEDADEKIENCEFARFMALEFRK